MYRHLVAAVSLWAGYCEVEGGRLYYELAGAGETIVFIHGYGIDNRAWDAQFDYFARHYHVLRYDLRGFGRSTPPAGEKYTHAGDLQALLAYLDISQAHVAGLSMGGWIATNFTLNYPHMVRSLALVDPALIGYNWSDEWNRLWGEIAAAGQAEGPQEANRRWLEHPIFAPAREQAEVAARLAQMTGDYSGWHWLNRDLHRSIRPPDSQRLDEITVPALIVVGERDLPDFLAIAGILHGGIAGAQKVVLPGVGHLSNMEAARAFNEIVGGFLQMPAAV